MQVFLTGATGYVGAAIARELLASGIGVTALVRNVEKARTVQALGMTPLIGELEDVGRHAAAAFGADAIVHAAFDDARGEEGDIRATRALLAVATQPSSRTTAFIYSSSAYNLRTNGGEPVDEHASTEPHRGVGTGWRFALEQEVLTAACDRLATSVMRLGLVYGGLGGTMPDLFAAIRAHGISFYLGEGNARISAIHRADAAHFYRAILNERGRGVFHGVDGSLLTSRAVAESIAEVVDCPGGVKGVRAEDAPHEFREHTRDVLERDVAIRNTRGVTVAWRPRFESIRAGTRHAYDEWRHDVHVESSLP